MMQEEKPEGTPPDSGSTVAVCKACGQPIPARGADVAGQSESDRGDGEDKERTKKGKKKGKSGKKDKKKKGKKDKKGKKK